MQNVSTGPSRRYRVYLVKPADSFQPTDAEDMPERFKIVRRLRGDLHGYDAETLCIVQNHRYLTGRQTEGWAVKLGD